jgi:hypothetical protein
MLLTALLAATLAAPVPKATPVYYFPTTVGAKKVWARGDKTAGVIEEVTKVEEKNGTLTVTVAYPEYGKAANCTYEVRDKQLRCLGSKEHAGYTLLDLGVKDGESWTRGIENGVRSNVTTFTLGKEEEVEVLAGKFKAIPVTEQDEQKLLKVTEWYAPGVGKVKTRFETMKGEIIWELLEFTPGEEAKK